MPTISVPRSDSNVRLNGTGSPAQFYEAQPGQRTLCNMIYIHPSTCMIACRVLACRACLFRLPKLEHLSLGGPDGATGNGFGDR
ncbi:hypothetical protein V1289_003251 [Bradyrhizobium sp. AZCC 2289]